MVVIFQKIKNRKNQPKTESISRLKKLMSFLSKDNEINNFIMRKAQIIT